MGIATSGLIRAEGNTTNAVLTGDRIVIQRYLSNNNGSYWTPFEATAGEIAAFALGGVSVLAVGQATLIAGVATVVLPTITGASLVLLTENSATPNAVGAVVTPATGFVIHSASGADTSVVNYIVLS